MSAISRGRPKRFEGCVNVSFYIPLELHDLIKQIDEVAHREGVSRSEWIWTALQDVLKEKYPGNPQPPLHSYTDPEALKPLRLQARFLQKDLRSDLAKLRELKDASSWWRETLTKKVQKAIIQITRMNRRLKSKKIDKLVDEALKVLE